MFLKLLYLIFNFLISELAPPRFGVCVQFYRPILAKQKVKENVEKPVVAFMLTTFCIITHHTFFNSTKECIHAFKLMFMKVVSRIYDS